jgi:uncharacterized protein (TIGR02145 family)
MKTKIFRNMKIVGGAALLLLLLLLLLLPTGLAAQNGVTVSNLAVNAGTVTFNVSWNKNTMPVALWSDTVWVFVDYNDNGTMKRLPLNTSGATLTATSAPGVGKVIPVSDNNKGVWVAGNARSVGSFSATVKLLTATAAGACAYASNYPPVGEYIAAQTIKFSGTPPYNLVLNTGSDQAYGNYNLLPGQTLQSFTDQTGAPGTMKCIPMTGDIDFVVPAVSKSQQISFVVSTTIDTPNPALVTYSWSAPDFSPATYEGATFTSIVPATPGTYPVTLTAHRKDYCDMVKTKDVEVLDCAAPGSTVNFTAFNPCTSAPTNSVWYLADTRESNNPQTYTVKLMADGRIWMVQDMKFGSSCTKTTFSGSSGSDQTGKLSTAIGYTGLYGDCRSGVVTGAGYYYDWAAAMQKSGAYSGGSFAGCTDAASGASCQGICPADWHVPTSDEFTNAARLFSAAYACADANCWSEASAWSGLASGWCSASGVVNLPTHQLYHTSTVLSLAAQYAWWTVRNERAQLSVYHSKDLGTVARCIRN